MASENTARIRRQAKADYRVKHPLCIFCGGIRPATTKDHLPPQSFFNARIAPEEFDEFPSCGKCNGYSRKYDLLFSFLARMYPDSPESEREAGKKLFQGVARTFPGLLEKMFEGVKATPRYLSAASNLRESLIGVNHPEVRRCMDLLGFKLACAVHYRESGKIIPLTGQVKIRYFTNYNLVNGEFPTEILDKLFPVGQISRAGKVLNDQFEYKRAGLLDFSQMAYLLKFRESLLLFLYVIMDEADAARLADETEDGNLVKTMQPFVFK